MRNLKKNIRILVVISMSNLLAFSGVVATTFVMMSDAALFDQADMVADVTVLSKGPSPASGAPSTEYLVLVESLLKGSTSEATLIVRVAGGVGSDGWRISIPGAPSFYENQRLILFLVARDDGTYGVLHLMLGAFYGVNLRAELIAVRDFSEAEQLGAQGDPLPEFARNYERFGDWLVDRSKGVNRKADYFEVIEASGITNDPQFVLMKPKMRYFEFDDGESVEWRINKRKQIPGTKHIWKKSLRTWNQAETCTPIRFRFAGTTKKRDPWTFDGVNSLTWEDPTDVMPGAFDCDRGGVIASSTWWFTGETKQFATPSCGQSGSAASLAGKKVRVLSGGDLVTNDGAKCLLRNKKARWQVFTHLLGHCLGLGHSCGDDDSGKCTPEKKAALMTSFYQQGRNGALTPYDVSQLRKLY